MRDKNIMNIGISSEDLVAAMVHAGLHGTDA